MSNELWDQQNFTELFREEYSLLDVRAPVEFHAGHIPGAVNFPLLNDEERVLVGTCYKQKGQAAAIALGHQLVSGSVKEQRLQAWLQDLQKNHKRLIMCFRGGLRSRTVQEWCRAEGIERPRVDGGYKAIRQFLLNQISDFSRHSSLCVMSGATGSEKTKLLRSLAAKSETRTPLPILDLEAYAHHRGSAFGAFLEEQPSQSTFENRLAVAITKLQTFQNVLIEDESRMIGRSAQPESLFLLLRQAPIILIDEPLQKRVENTFGDYILNSPIQSGSEEMALLMFDRYMKATSNIQKKLGGLRATEVLRDIENSRQDYLQRRQLESNQVWIEKLLKWYYDPMYFDSLQKRQPRKLFQGTWNEVYQYCSEISNQEI